MSRIVTAFIVGLIGTLGFAQDPTTRNDIPECDLATVEDRPYCPRDAVFLQPDQIERSRHMACGTEIANVPACVKSAFPCKMHGDGWVLHSRRCCPINVKDCCVETTVLSRVEYVCLTCRRRHVTERVAHESSKCPTGSVVRTCAKSSLYPHGGRPAPAFGEP
jgi:hypothetical protein